jgi:hypothetical protein
MRAAGGGSIVNLASVAGEHVTKASKVAHLPPVSTLFAAFLGNNPIGRLLQPTGALGSLPAHSGAVLTGNGSSRSSSRARSTTAW